MSYFEDFLRFWGPATGQKSTFSEKIKKYLSSFKNNVTLFAILRFLQISFSWSCSFVATMKIFFDSHHWQMWASSKKNCKFLWLHKANGTKLVSVVFLWLHWLWLHGLSAPEHLFWQYYECYSVTMSDFQLPDILAVFQSCSLVATTM